MEAIQAGLGFIFGVVIFLAMLSKLRMLFVSYYALVFFFVISLALGVILAKVLSWFIIVLIVIGIIAAIYSKLKSPSNESENQDGASDETTAHSETNQQ